MLTCVRALRAPSAFRRITWKASISTSHRQPPTSHMDERVRCAGVPSRTRQAPTARSLTYDTSRVRGLPWNSTRSSSANEPKAANRPSWGSEKGQVRQPEGARQHDRSPNRPLCREAARILPSEPTEGLRPRLLHFRRVRGPRHARQLLLMPTRRGSRCTMVVAEPQVRQGLLQESGGTAGAGDEAPPARNRQLAAFDRVGDLANQLSRLAGPIG